jgi:uncharacterized protein YdbL (DUF1318 family)
MMKRLSIVIVCMFVLACAKLSVETKEPIKVDVNMRVDIYQHVVKDVQSINDQIYGGSEKEFNSLFFIQDAFAQVQDNAMQNAIAMRKTRFKEIEHYFVMGYIGENRDALLEIRSQIPQAEVGRVKKAVAAENADRQTIYKAIAAKNATDISQTRKVFFEDDYKRALSGFLFEKLDGNRYIWVEK